MLPSALAIGAVAAVVLLLIGVFGESGANQTAATTPPAGSPGVTSSPLPTASTPPTSAPSVTVPSTTVPPTGSAPATSVSVPTEFPDILTVVLNSTAESGLAGRVSAYLGELGWEVGPVGNFETTTETTTVYYPEGYEEAARALAAVAPGSGSSIAPAGEDVSADTLTVVLGEDAADWVDPTDGDASEGASPPPTT